MSRGDKKFSLVSRQMREVPMTPAVDNDYIAKLLAQEASQRRKSFNSIGLAAYRNALPSTAPKEINKIFLANTIRGVDNHNRREEVDDCWRVHRLLTTKIDESSRSAKRSHDSSSSSSSSSSNKREDETEREYWARLKVKKLNTEHLNQDDAPGSVVVRPSSVLLALPAASMVTNVRPAEEEGLESDSRTKTKKRRKDKKHHNKKTKKKKADKDSSENKRHASKHVSSELDI